VPPGTHLELLIILRNYKIGIAAVEKKRRFILLNYSNPELNSSFNP
tara:strand:- start:418 stop:555 length:138 start_codon:yes stop_codon:yes gene_type:complete